MLDTKFNEQEQLPDVRQEVAKGKDPIVDAGKAVRITKTLFFVKSGFLLLGYVFVVIYFFVLWT
jgi:hypothetical protein